MKRFRIRDGWRRITPLAVYPLLLRAAEAVFLHHSVTEMPPGYGPAVNDLLRAERRYKSARRQRGKVDGVDRQEWRRVKRQLKRARGVVLDFERAHMRDKLESIAVNRGFLGISYSIAAFQSGHVWKARGWRRVGAHTLGHNDRAVAIVAVGNFETTKPSAQLEEAIARTIHKGRKLRRLQRGFGFRPHSDVSATACPGRLLRARMKPIKARVERLAA